MTKDKAILDKSYLSDIIKLCRNATEEIANSDVVLLQEQLNILQNLISSKEVKMSDKGKEYWQKAKLGKAYYLSGNGEKSMEELYGTALHAITTILDILRGEPLTINIQKIQRNSKNQIVGIEIITAKEKDLALKYNNLTKSIEYDLSKTAENLLNIQQASAEYIEHYSKFYNIADTFIARTRSKSKKTGKTTWRKRINEGHIVEAYQRHLVNLHNSLNTTYDEPLEERDVIISLWYSLGKTPWWKQGDIDYMQIKANNLRLASISSIQRVSTKILEMFSNKRKFDIKEFNELFTKDQQEELLDVSKIRDSELDLLAKEIKEDKNFRNIKINMFIR